MVSDIVHLTVAGILGLCVGSFIATLVIRWPLGTSVIIGRSRCDTCGKPVEVTDLIPVWSYAWLKGKARCCRAVIDLVHPATEILAGLIGLVSCLWFGPQWITCAIFGWLLLTIAMLDARHFWLPDHLTALLAILGVLSSVWLPQPDLTDRMLGGVAGWAMLAIIASLYKSIRKRDGIGGGDPKLFGAIGIWVGWQALPSVLLIAALAGLGSAFLWRLAGKPINNQSHLPLGTFLAMAAWPCWIYQQVYSLPPFIG